MYSECNIPEINQCSTCNTLLEKEWKLLKCLHGICNVCIVQQRIDSGMFSVLSIIIHFSYHK